MSWIVIGAAAALFIALVLLRFLPIISLPRPLPRPAPRKPAPKAPPVRAFPLVNVQKQPGQITLRGITGGEYWADEIIVADVNRLSTSLTLVAERVLKINGNLLVSRRLLGEPTVDVTLACRDGDVITGPNGTVDMESSAPSAGVLTVPGLAQSDAGMNGGHIMVIGINIVHAGKFQSGSGGDGGRADADAGQPRWGSRAKSAVAVAGCGGYGGDVLLCALETIKLLPNSSVGAGASGQGGLATATPSHFGDGYAHGGDNLIGGDVRFEASGPGVCMVLISDTAVVTGGEVNGRRAGDADVRPLAAGGANNTGTGGRAEAIGGTGGVGGNVLFDNNCRVDNRGEVRSGDGDDGGNATATGGGGMWIPLIGFHGGNAWARGGNGAMAGTKPQYLNPAGQLESAQRGNAGIGGEAEAVGGSGGTANPNRRGGASGSSQAQGGDSGNGNKAIDVYKPAQPPTGPNGGDGVRAWSEGAHR